MSLNEWMNSKMEKLHWTDISLVKLSTAAFVLMLAILWPPLLSLEWYWYGLVFVIAAIKPLYKVFS
jgi:hypothetical protein